MQANNENNAGDQENRRYLIFSLGSELYASPLEMVREVLKNTDVKEVPYMKSYFRGVINVRGQIISVVDLREKFGVKKNEPSNNMLLVVEREGQYLAAVVDEVVAVGALMESDIERKPALSTKIPVDFFLGIGKWNDRLLNLIDVAGSLSAEDFSTIQRTKEAV
jgi:purine-binding chemotaxis protein CheW